LQDIEDSLAQGLQRLKDYLRHKEAKGALEDKRESVDSGVGEESDSISRQARDHKNYVAEMSALMSMFGKLKIFFLTICMYIGLYETL
jgi:hypothetical protein